MTERIQIISKALCSASIDRSNKISVASIPYVEVTSEHKNTFQKNGFVVFNEVIPLELTSKVKARFEPLFSGQFDTGIYPDEWHWREGISKPDAFREIVNAWKSDSMIRSVVLSSQLGKLATDLMDWPVGSRIAQDDLLWKPPLTKGVGYHQDSAYISKQFKPIENNSVTIWIALDDADKETGVVQYLKSSHLPVKKQSISNDGAANSQLNASSSSFHNSDIDTSQNGTGMLQYEIVAPTVKEGSVIVHHQDVWHGSSNNRSNTRPRRALGVHLLRSDVCWNNEKQPIDYIYGRYVLKGENVPREEFFPITYRK